MREGNAREPSNDEYLHSGSRIKPRQSLTAVPTDVLNELQAEDLSRTGKQQGREIGIRSDQCWHIIGNNSQMSRVGDADVGNSPYAYTVNMENGKLRSGFIDEEELEPIQSPYWNVENYGGDKSSPFSKTQHAGLRAVDSRRPLSCGRNMNVAEDINGWLSASVIRPAEKRPVAEKSPSAASTDLSRNWNTPAQLTQSSGRQESYSEAALREERSMSAAGRPSSDVRGVNSGTLSVPPGGKTISTGLSSSFTVFSPPVANSGRGYLRQDSSSKTSSFPPRRGLESLGSTSSGVFARTPVLPTGMRVHTLAGLWPTPGRALGEPSPVATVMPQVQTAAGNLGHHPAHQSDPTENAENILAPAQPRKRKRKRRSVFGSRRRNKKSHQTTAPAATHNPVSDISTNKQAAVIAKPNPVANVTVTGVHTTTNSSLARSEVPEINGNPVSVTSLHQSVPNASLGTQPDGMRKALKPIENQQRQQQRVRFLTSRSSDIHKPSSAKRSIHVGSWLDMNAAGSGHETQPLTTYLKRRPSSADVQKVPSTSPQCDIFEFCGDDDETDSAVDRLTLRSFRGTSSPSPQCFSWPAVQKPLAAVTMAGGKFSNSVTVSKLR